MLWDQSSVSNWSRVMEETTFMYPGFVEMMDGTGYVCQSKQESLWGGFNDTVCDGWKPMKGAWRGSMTYMLTAIALTVNRTEKRSGKLMNWDLRSFSSSPSPKPISRWPPSSTVSSSLFGFPIKPLDRLLQTDQVLISSGYTKSNQCTVGHRSILVGWRLLDSPPWLSFFIIQGYITISLVMRGGRLMYVSDWSLWMILSYAMQCSAYKTCCTPVYLYCTAIVGWCLHITQLRSTVEANDDLTRPQIPMLWSRSSLQSIHRSKLQLHLF